MILRAKIYTHIFITLLLFAASTQCFSQYPHYFSYDNENGLPSNEVYSIVQDQKGFIWIGCDAGLFKFDGVRYIPYKCTSQKSNPITGLTFSSSGKLYCYNFQSQIFYLENNALKELTRAYSKPSGIAADNAGNIFVTHLNGISQFNENSKKWTDYSGFLSNNFTGSAYINSKNEVCFITSDGIGTLSNGKINIDTCSYFKPVGRFIMAKYNDEHYIFSTHKDIAYKEKNGKIYDLKNSKLYSVVQNRKITNAVFLPDNHLWICTYKGILKYNPATDSVALYFPEISFSNCMVDREGNYWLTTLHSGLMRIVNMEYLVWNKENPLLQNDKITKITTDSTHIYFATANGTIGKLNAFTNDLQTFHTGNNADVQSLDYVFEEHRLYFNINDLYYLQNNQLSQKEEDIKSIKAFRKVNHDYFVLNSFGVYVRGKENYKISGIWARELQFDKANNTVWIASNKGILKCVYQNKKCQIEKTVLPGVQILSLDFDSKTHQLFALDFDGHIYKLSEHESPKKITAIPVEIQVKKFKYVNDDKIYVATNKGLWIFDLSKKQWNNLNSLSGLASENVQDLAILNDNLWLATGKGLQKIPLSNISEKPLAKVYLKNQQENINLNYGETLLLQPEVSAYSSNGQFEYAYCINKNEWLNLPATIEQIEIQNLPAGNFEIELKVIDHAGRDSENTITLKGFVNPPFWLSWWFIALFFLLITAAVFFIVKKIIADIRRREMKKTQLVNSQLTALKAQMNPHFIFNVLNTIKGYIYENNKEKATDYLDDFSDLIRKTLDMSETQYTSLDDELKIIKLYIELEGMMLSDSFSYTFNIDESLDKQIKIPSMIIQPYVENAFKHGLRHKKGIKKLNFSIQPLGETDIQIEITDNGIGRKQVAEINNQNSYKKTSFATAAIEKRMALLNAQGNQNICIETIDLYNEQGTGTQVIIQLKNCEYR